MRIKTFQVLLIPVVLVLELISPLFAAPLPSPTQLTTLSSAKPCNQCNGTLLPGRTHARTDTKWGVISDLPESFGSHGVLYSTRDQLPDNGGAESLRQQRKTNGFTTIDGGFDVFFFHISRMTTGSRIVVYVKNKGQRPAILESRQVIKSEGIIGAEHEFESTLGKRVLANQWDQVSARALKSYATPEITFTPGMPNHYIPRVTIQPGRGEVIAYGKQFGNVEDSQDASNNVNCFGYVRTILVDPVEAPDLEVSILAIPAGARPGMKTEAEALLHTGARTTDKVPMDREPQGCALGRAVGVYPNFYWSNDPLIIDASRLSLDGTTFSMCLPEIQTSGCSDARQTTDLALRPGYTRPDTIGNYMIEYQVSATLTNPTVAPVSADFVFSKTGADIGLAYTIDILPGEATVTAPMPASEVTSLWAGPKQSSVEKSLLPGSQPISIPAGASRHVTLRFLVCGNSSLPFNLGFKRSAPF